MSDYTSPDLAPVWYDLTSSDPDRAVGFYGALFGWEAEPPNEQFGGYRNFRVNGRVVAGLSPAMGEVTDVWSVYLRADDIAGTVEKAKAAGAQPIVEPMPVGDLGTMAVVIDPAGAAIGFWQPGTHVGFTQRGEHGTPYWFDCLSQDYAASRDFYGTTLGIGLQEVGTGGGPDVVGPDRYTLLTYGGDGQAGLMDAKGMLPGDPPSLWQVYITVDDVAAAVEQAAALGGGVVMAGEDTPWGTLATITDPNGAFISLGHPPAGM